MTFLLIPLYGTRKQLLPPPRNSLRLDRIPSTDSMMDLYSETPTEDAIPDLKKVLCDSHLYQKFLNFCSFEFCVENVLVGASHAVSDGVPVLERSEEVQRGDFL
jgi:hypothetical protein